MDLESYLKDRYYEFWYDIYNIEKKEVRALKNYIDYLEKNLRKYKISESTGEWVEDLFVRKHLDYLEEAFSNLILGNYNAFGSIVRIMIENYACYSIIKKYRKIEIWKDWYLWSTLKTIKGYEDKPNYGEAEKLFKELCKKFQVEDSSVSNTSNYGWVERITKNKRNSFKSICTLVDETIYEDFKELSSYSHNTNLYIKFNPILMERLAGFIYQLFTYSDKFVYAHNFHITKRKEYNNLCVDLLENLDTCINYREFESVED